MGWVLFQMGRAREGQRFLAQAAALTQDPIVHEHLGDCYLELDRPADAVAAYRAAHEAGADSDRLGAKLAEARRQTGDSTEPDGETGVYGVEETP
jgi:predicted negative regulator of RcsB-dependent stress response